MSFCIFFSVYLWQCIHTPKAGLLSQGVFWPAPPARAAKDKLAAGGELGWKVSEARIKASLKAT